MPAPVIPYSEYLRALDLLATAGATLYMELYQNDYTPLPGSVYADFTIATYSGHVAQAVGWGAATLGGDNKGAMLAGPFTFACDGLGTTNDCYGWLIREPITSAMFLSKRFDAAPKSFVLAGDQVTINITYKDVQNP